MDYDKNGNITALSRNGWKSNNSYGLINNLTYSYDATSNKILKVDDNANETASFRDVSGDDYEYWLDGSLKKDNNKDITQIDYNYLKLPQKINLTGGRWIEYEYDAGGTKLKKTLSTGEITDYEEDEILVNGNLYQTSHDEGRIVNDVYEYNITDHLGNQRVAFKDNNGIPEVVQYQNHGAWGESLDNINYSKPNDNEFTFSTYEKENDFGINVFDAHARVYDATTPRFWQIDPKTEDYEHLTGYNFTENNPILLTDPDGMAPRYNWETKKYMDGDKEVDFDQALGYYNNGGSYSDMGGGDSDNGDKNQGGETKPASGVSEGSLLRYVPMVGSGLDAYDSFSEGNIGMGLLHTGLAISDAFLVKSLITGVGKAVWKAGAKDGIKRYFGVGMSHEAGNAISRLKRLGVFPRSSNVHHWLLHDDLLRANPWLKPLGNQAWNFKDFASRPSHMRWAHGQAFPSLGLGKIPAWQLMYPVSSTPAWVTFGAIPYTIKSAKR